MSNEKKLSPEQAAINAALVAQYDKPAKIIGKKADAIEKAKGDTWSAFKDGAVIGLEAGQDVATMAKGLTLACAHHGVPQGTVNAYLPLLRKLYVAVAEQGMPRDEALALSVKEAREKWQPKKAKAIKEKAEEKAEGTAGTDDGEAGDGTVGDADGMLGGTERSRVLAEINRRLCEMSDDDLRGFLAMLQGEVEMQEAA